MAKRLKRICVNCASSPGAHPEYGKASREFGRILAGQGISLVYGGSNVGLMGEIANSVLSHGGEVIGVITEELNKKVGHGGLQELHVVPTMHERKTKMFQLSDAFVAMPGGLGTLEEIMEILTWAQLGLHSKPVGFLNIRGYFDHLMDFLDHAVDQRFLRIEHRQMLLVAQNPDRLLADMEAYLPSSVEKWIDRK
ncbi:MAG TPA: TIGR00730 family Rossman fold protein [bacterium]